MDCDSKIPILQIVLSRKAIASLDILVEIARFQEVIGFPKSAI
jgi:hypothetical protein